MTTLRSNARVVRVLVAMILIAILVAPSVARGAVGGGRTIEVFYNRSLVMLVNYPPNTEVLTEVYRGATLIATATYTTDDTGFLEINHTGVDDCWTDPATNQHAAIVIQPGDEVHTQFLDGVGNTVTDFTATRDVFVDEASITFTDDTLTEFSTISVSGHVISLANAPIDVANDVLELRLNKDNAADVWDNTGRRDLREDINADVQADGSFTHIFTVSDADAADVQANGMGVALEWSPAVLEGEVIPEITVWDPAEGEPLACAGGVPPEEEEEEPEIEDQDGDGVADAVDPAAITRAEYVASKQELKFEGFTNGLAGAMLQVYLNASDSGLTVNVADDGRFKGEFKNVTLSCPCTIEVKTMDGSVASGAVSIALK